MELLHAGRRPLAHWALPLLVLLTSLGACQSRPGEATQAGATPLPTGHFAGTLQVPGQPDVHAVLEVRHPRRGHYDAELVLPDQPLLSFVADTLTFGQDTLRLARPGRPDESLALGRQGDFWRGSLVLDSVRYPVLLVRRGPPEPAVYQVRRDEVAGTSGPALLFSPADESLPGLGIVFFATAATARTAPTWADALARLGHTVLLLPPSDTLTAPDLSNALAYLRRTPGVDTARVGAWATGRRAAALPALLAEEVALRPAFVLVQDAPAPTPATRRNWQQLARRQPVLALYDPAQAKAVAGLRAALGPRRVVRTTGPAQPKPVVDWLRDQQR